MLLKELWLLKQLISNVSVDKNNRTMTIRGFTVPDNYSDEEVENALSLINKWVKNCPKENMSDCIQAQYKQYEQEQKGARHEI